MDFDELTKALRANEIEITDADYATFQRSDAAILRDLSATYNEAAARPCPPTWAQLANLNRTALESIAENYEWAAEQIERLAQVAA